MSCSVLNSSFKVRISHKAGREEKRIVNFLKKGEHESCMSKH